MSPPHSQPVRRDSAPNMRFWQGFSGHHITDLENRSRKSVMCAASPPFGNTYDVLSVEWWLWFFMEPTPDNPVAGAPCSNGQSGNVWFLLGGPPAVDCTIPAGTALFFPIVNTECSSLEPFPFHGDTPQQRQDCAKAWIDNVTDLAATIDGN